jgi:hypothetical protein
VYDENADTDSIMLLKRTATDVIRGGIVFATLFQTLVLEERESLRTLNAVKVHDVNTSHNRPKNKRKPLRHRVGTAQLSAPPIFCTSCRLSINSLIHLTDP